MYAVRIPRAYAVQSLSRPPWGTAPGDGRRLPRASCVVIKLPRGPKLGEQTRRRRAAAAASAYPVFFLFFSSLEYEANGAEQRKRRACAKRDKLRRAEISDSVKRGRKKMVPAMPHFRGCIHVQQLSTSTDLFRREWEGKYTSF